LHQEDLPWVFNNLFELYYGSVIKFFKNPYLTFQISLMEWFNHLVLVLNLYSVFFTSLLLCAVFDLSRVSWSDMISYFVLLYWIRFRFMIFLVKKEIFMWWFVCLPRWVLRFEPHLTSLTLGFEKIIDNPGFRIYFYFFLILIYLQFLWEIRFIILIPILRGKWRFSRFFGWDSSQRAKSMYFSDWWHFNNWTLIFGRFLFEFWCIQIFIRIFLLQNRALLLSFSKLLTSSDLTW